MAVPESAPQRIADARQRFADLLPHLRPAELRDRVGELETAMGAAINRRSSQVGC